MNVYLVLDGDIISYWYCMINCLIWIWCGVDLFEIEEVLLCIVCFKVEYSDNELFDIVVGYCNGNWIYEWVY